MSQLKFGLPKILPPNPFTLEVELPYQIADVPHIIKVSTAETLVKSWVEAEKNVLATIEEYAENYITNKFNQDNLNEHEFLVLNPTKTEHEFLIQ